MTPRSLLMVPQGWKQLQLEVARGTQDVNLEEVLKGPREVKLRIRIRSDAYAFQSYALAEAWDGSKWQEVCKRQHGQMQTKEGMKYLPHDNFLPLFEADRNYLFALAREILGVVPADHAA